MTPENITARAVRFAENLKLTNFVKADPVTRELYGTFAPVLDERKLRAVYERNETCWRDWPAFLSTMQQRLGAYCEAHQL